MFNDLIEKGLVKGKQDKATGLFVYKYAKRVFYDNLWNTDPLLLEARGMVLDAEGNKVIWPFTKVFNYGENGTTCRRDTRVEAVEKVNGFMAAARYVNGKVLVSTTGSLDSDFVQLARRVLFDVIPEYDVWWAARRNHTLLFEICDPSDPHIVNEEPGAYLIGARDMRDGHMASEDLLDFIAQGSGFKRPRRFVAPFDDAAQIAVSSKIEGYMIRSFPSGEYLMKIKSSHYLSKKFIMRMGAGKVKAMWENPQIYKAIVDEEFEELVEYLTTTYHMNVWFELTDQDRRVVIERYFETR